MVSTRSGNRTTRPSPGEPEKSEAPKPTETPKRRGRPAKNVKKVFDDEESVTSGTPTVTPQVSTQVSVESVESVDSGADNEPEIVQEEPKTLSPKKSEPKTISPTKSPKNIPSPKKELSEQSIPLIDVEDSDVVEEVKISPKKSESSISLKKEDSEVPEEDSDDDDDEPMEISSKKAPEAPEDVVRDSEGSDDDDDEPMEVTSSKVVEKGAEKGAEPKSIVEKLLEKKAEKSARIAAKKLKKRNKKKEMKKISDGVFEVKMKKSKAKFNVVTLSNGVQKMLEPEVNFREELLKARTAGTRCVDTEKFYQRAKWVSRR